MKNEKSFKEFYKKYGTAAIMVVLFIFFSIAAPSFLSVSSIMSLLRQTSVTAIISVGMAIVMLTGGIDLSVGAIVALTSVMSAWAMVNWKLPIILAVLIGLIVGILTGFVNGLLVTYIKVPALIATLGTQQVIRGIAYIITGGYTIFGFPESFSVIGRGYVFKVIPVPVIIMIVVLFAGGFLLNKTKFGRYTYAIGGNMESARLAGINVNKRLVIDYVISGALASVAGIVELSRLSSGQPSAGEGYDMSAITAVVLGGISVSGGEGKFVGVIFGILIMGLLSTGLVMMNVSTYWQQLIKGLVLLLAVCIDQILKRGLLEKTKRVRS